MELKVNTPDWRTMNGGMAYDVEQVAGSTRYWNRRIVSRAATGVYKSPTHEYLDIPPAGRLTGAWFCDHADGANRPAKLTRDIILLQEALRTETDPGLRQRYNFYLGQSYYDLGKYQQAADYYFARFQLGGWAEEAWYAQYRYALCQKHQGHVADFVHEMLKAYELRPQRMEPLYELARYYREKGNGNLRSLLFSVPGLDQKVSDDSLFVDTYAHTTGMREEFAICAYYDERRRKAGGKEANRLALENGGSWQSREQARTNLYWYLQPLSLSVPSFRPERLKFEPEDGWVAMNPSVVSYNDIPLVLVRTVNYRITPEGRYVSRTGDVGPGGVPVIRTRNFLLPMGSAAAVELELPVNLPSRKFDLVCGFEDSRLFAWQGGLWTLSTVRELTSEGWCEQVLASISDRGYYGSDWRVITPELGRRHEKNWMPWPRHDGRLESSTGLAP